MMEMSSFYFSTFKKNKVATMLLIVFFVISTIEIIAEYEHDTIIIWLTKPLILPFLLLYYLKRSKRKNLFFIIALLFSWIANILFIHNTFEFIIYGVVFFILYRILVIYIITKKVKMPNALPLLLGAIPFVFIYFSVTIFTYAALGNGVYLFLGQGIFTVFLGGFSLGNYIINANKPNFVLFISTMFMALNQFVFLLKLYYPEVYLLQAFAMILFVLGQFLLTKYMFYTEKNKYQYQIINKLSPME